MVVLFLWMVLNLIYIFMEEQMSSVENSSPNTKHKTPSRLFASGVAVVVFLAILVGIGWGMWSVGQMNNDPTTIGFARVFGISVAKVNGLEVSYADYATDFIILEKFYGQAPTGLPQPTEDEISDQVLSRLVINALITDFAKKYNVSVSKEEVESSDVMQQLVAAAGGRETATAEIQNRYGLDFDSYVEKVIAPVVLEQKLQQAFEVSTDESGVPYEEEQVRARHILFQTAGSSKSESKLKTEAQSVLARIKNGEDFAELAKQYGSDGTKELGGDLGWFGKGRMVKEFEEAAFGLQPGGLAPEVVKTQFGYHIIKVEEKRKARNYSKFMGDELRLARIELTKSVHNPFLDLQAELNAQYEALGATSTEQ